MTLKPNAHVVISSVGEAVVEKSHASEPKNNRTRPHSKHARPQTPYPPPWLYQRTHKKCEPLRARIFLTFSLSLRRSSAGFLTFSLALRFVLPFFIVITVERYDKFRVVSVVERKLDKVLLVKVIDHRVHENIVVDVGGFITLIRFERRSRTVLGQIDFQNLLFVS